MTAGRCAARSWGLLSVCVLLVCADQETITAESGQNVTLSCRFPNNKNIVGLEWSRTDLEKEYVLLYRDGRLDAAFLHSSFKNRVDLQDRRMRDGDMSLILKDVTTADSGTYETRVKTEAIRRNRAYLGGDPICAFNLSVVPPGQPGGLKDDRNFGPVSAGLIRRSFLTGNI